MKNLSKKQEAKITMILGVIKNFKKLDNTLRAYFDQTLLAMGEIEKNSGVIELNEKLEEIMELFKQDLKGVMKDMEL